MKYIKFSSDSDCFSAKHTGSFLHLTWFSTLDLSSVKKVGLSSFHINPIVENHSNDYDIVIYCNLIQTTELNPLGELDYIRIPKKHSTIPNQLHLGNFSIFWNYYS